MAERRGRGRTRRPPSSPLPIDVYIDFARALFQRVQAALGWSNKETGEACGLSTSMITQWHHGKVDLSLRSFLRLSLALGVDLDTVFVPKSHGLRQQLIEYILLLDDTALPVVYPMIEAFVSAQRARQVAELAIQEDSA